MNLSPNEKTTINFKEGLRGIRQATIGLIVCQVLRFIVMTWLGSFQISAESEHLLTTIISLIIEAIIFYFLYIGKKWPIYLFCVSLIFIFSQLLSIHTIWGNNPLSMFILIFAWLMFILETSLVAYLLLYPDCRNFYRETKKQ